MRLFPLLVLCTVGLASIVADSNAPRSYLRNQRELAANNTNANKKHKKKNNSNNHNITGTKDQKASPQKNKNTQNKNNKNKQKNGDAHSQNPGNNTASVSSNATDSDELTNVDNGDTMELDPTVNANASDVSMNTTDPEPTPHEDVSKANEETKNNSAPGENEGNTTDAAQGNATEALDNAENNDHNTPLPSEGPTVEAETSFPSATPIVEKTNAPTVLLTSAPSAAPVSKETLGPTLGFDDIDSFPTPESPYDEPPPHKSPVKSPVKSPLKSPVEDTFSEPTTSSIAEPTKSPEEVARPETLEEEAEDIIEDKNVQLVSVIFAVFFVALVLFVAQQMVENPDGLCARICRCMVATFRIICYPVRSCFCYCCMSSRAKERRTHELVSTQGYDEYDHDLALT